ncbi:hypothetical protein JVT61DRAFT_11095 [Boletus reticuloceps]|uniref:Uncharacterized protein n=1 Tax=Boletus reticuloceps TaxID=495285 RepID=A0A8I2YF03_9AGAM|nr:hypothetical protein JVT61DRAFT_11095 [Boletus reticuloceps]
MDSSKAPPVKLAKVIKVFIVPLDPSSPDAIDTVPPPTDTDTDSITPPLHTGPRTHWLPRRRHPSPRRVHGRHDAEYHSERERSRTGTGYFSLVGERA